MTLLTFQTSRRRVDVLVPDDGDSRPRPVLLMHDGQNLFEPENSTFGQTWEVPRAVSNLSDISVPRPVVVGVWHSGFTRGAELAPEQAVGDLPFGFTINQLEELHGDAYQDELIREVLPAVYSMANCRTDRESTGVCGSSMGGLASLYAVARYPETYGTAIAVATHWKMSQTKMALNLINMLPSPENGHRFWFDRGTESIDTYYGHIQVDVEKLLADRGYAWPAVESRSYVASTHNELDWSIRFPIMLRWWLEGLK